MGSNRAICTIVAKNYLAYARTLCESYQALHPGERCFVLIVDDYHERIDPTQEPFEVLGVEDLEIPHFYPQFAFKYNVTELSTAVKPYLLELLFKQKGVDKLLYLDPDILVLHRLDHLFESLDQSDLILTPHVEADYPDDGKFPDDAATMRVGMFNLGFLGINSGPNADRFLQWWKGKLYDRCVVDFAAGLHVDQKYLDLALFLFEGIHVEKDTGYNVAIHNLHSRHLSLENGRWLCNGKPLYFYHFCGYNYRYPNEICKYFGGNVRYNLENRPDLRPLVGHYRERLRANGHEEALQWKYTYGYFDTGRPIWNAVRAAYRKATDLRKEEFNPFHYDELRTHFPAAGPTVAAELLGEAFALITAGDSREALRRLDEACTWENTAKMHRTRWGYRRWAAKLWLRGRLGRGTRPGRHAMASG
jgi:hypothetical protein